MWPQGARTTHGWLRNGSCVTGQIAVDRDLTDGAVVGCGVVQLVAGCVPVRTFVSGVKLSAVRLTSKTSRRRRRLSMATPLVRRMLECLQQQQCLNRGLPKTRSSDFVIKIKLNVFGYFEPRDKPKKLIKK